jgi:hypothetical protein
VDILFVPSDSTQLASFNRGRFCEEEMIWNGRNELRDRVGSMCLSMIHAIEFSVFDMAMAPCRNSSVFGAAVEEVKT